MSRLVVGRLLGIFAVIALGWLAGRTRALSGPEVVAALYTVAFTIFIPALLFRTTARIDVAALPWSTLAAFFGPVVTLLLVVHAWHRARGARSAAPSVRGISTTFGNLVQLGIPLMVAVFGQTGLALHVAVVSLHALVLLTVSTALAELDLARDGAPPGERPRPGTVLAHTVRRTLVHPVVLPVLAGLSWNVLRVPIPGPLDALLATLGQGVVPVSLVVIGMSLQQFGLGGAVGGAAAASAIKLVLQPGLVLAVAHWGAGLHGLPLGVVVMGAALPIGSNALLFAQRYRTLEAETTAAIVFSMLAFVVTGPLWLLAVSAVAP